jgi:hypothetical protein
MKAMVPVAPVARIPPFRERGRRPSGQPHV